LPQTLEQVLAQFKLSRQPFVRTGDPVFASKFAKKIQAALNNPDFRKRIEKIGGPAMFAQLQGLVDIPMDATAIMKGRSKERNLDNRGVFDYVSEGLADTFTHMGLDEPMMRIITGEGAEITPFSAGGVVEGDPSVDLPFLGEVNPVSLGAQIASFLVPAAGAVKLAGAGVAATGLAASHPAWASAASYALGGSALEATRQGLNVHYKNQEWDPAQIALEGAIFGAGGTPVGGGAIGSRARAGLMSGTAATLLPPLVGKDVDPHRVAMETMFGVVFGNPKLGDLAAPDIPVPPAKGEAPGPIITPPPKEAVQVLTKAKEKIVETKAPRIKQQLKKAEVETGDPDGSLKARQEGIDKLSQIPEEALVKMALEPDVTPEMRVLIRDSLLSRKGRALTDVDAPVDVTPPPVKERALTPPKEEEALLSALAQKHVDDNIFRAPSGDPQRISDQVLYQALTRRTLPVKPKEAKRVMKELTPEERMAFTVEAERMKDLINTERSAQGKPALEDKALDKETADRMHLDIKYTGDGEVVGLTYDRTAILPTTKQQLRQVLIEDLRLDRDNAMKAAMAAKGDEVLTRDAGPIKSPKREAAETRIDARSRQIETMEQAVEDAPVVVESQALARKMADQLTENMTAKEIEEFPLPKVLEFFRGDIKNYLKQKAQRVRNPVDVVDESASVRRYNTDPETAVTVGIRGGSLEHTQLKQKRAKTQKGLSFKELQKEMGERGLDLTFIDGEFRVHTGADSIPVRSLKEAKAFLKTVDDMLDPKSKPVKEVKVKETPEAEPIRIDGPTIEETPPEFRISGPAIDEPGGGFIPAKLPVQGAAAPVKAAAKRKLIQVDHVGEGVHRTVNRKTGEVNEHPNLQSVAKQVAQTETPPSVEIGAPSLPPGDIPPSGGGTVGGLGGDGRYLADFELPVSTREFPSTFSNTFGMKGELMKSMEDATQVPVWTEVWEPMMKGLNLRDKFTSPARTSLAKILRGIKANRRRAPLDLLIAGKRAAQVAKDYSLRPKEVKAAKAAREWFRETFGWSGKELDTFFEEVIPAFRRADGDANRAYPGHEFPGMIHEIAEDVLNGHVKLDEPNLWVLANDMVSAYGNRRYMDEPIARTLQVQRKLGATIVSKDVLPLDRRQASTMNELVNQFKDQAINGMQGGETIAKAMNGLRDIFRRWGLVDETDWTAHDVSRVASATSSFISGAALSARVAPAFRNKFQTLLAGYKVGFKTLHRAERWAHTPEGKKMVAESGVIPGRMTYLIEEMAELAAGDKTTLGWIQRAQSLGMFLYKGADHSNRATSYLAGHQSIRDWAHLLKEGKVDEFLINTGLALESSTTLNRILEPLRKADKAGWDSALTRAGHEYGLRISDDTQFIYNPANSPAWMNTVPGRFFGQFGVWPLAFAELTMRTGIRNLGGNSAQKAAAKNFMKRMLLTNLALATLGIQLGVDTSSYNRANPLDFDGGPAWNAVRDSISLGLGTGGEFDQRVAKRNLERFLHTFYFPFGGALQDIQQAFDENDPYRAFLTALGFNLERQ
jgi:hypothetical protein